MLSIKIWHSILWLYIMTYMCAASKTVCKNFLKTIQWCCFRTGQYYQNIIVVFLNQGHKGTDVLALSLPKWTRSHSPFFFGLVYVYNREFTHLFDSDIVKPLMELCQIDITVHSNRNKQSSTYYILRKYEHGVICVFYHFVSQTCQDEKLPAFLPNCKVTIYKVSWTLHKTE